MKYIILDLEWNQCPEGKEYENPRLPFEIIEIGAVKMNEQKQIEDMFNSLVNPLVYQKIHHRTKEVIGLRIAELKSARVFSEVIKDFIAWCGEDYKFCTWGSMDLTELQRNMKFYRINNPFPKPLFYYDVQKLYSLLYGSGKNRISLQNAVEALDIKLQGDFHRAASDTYYTANIMKRMNLELVKEYDSVDYFRPPDNKKEEVHVVFRRYAKYVSRHFSSKEEAMSDRGVTATRCYQCGKMLRKQIRWFPVGQKHYLCLSYCPQHGFMKGKIRIKKTENGRVFVVRTLKLITEEEAEWIRKKQDEVKIRQRERRKHIRENKK